jgi:cyclohexyl-isocyanide hydratase
MRWLFHALPRGIPLGDSPYAPEALAREGFVHASYRDVLAQSVRAHMGHVPAVDVLQIDPRRLGPRVEVAETPRGPMPHIHGPIPRDAIAAVISFEEFERTVASWPDRVTGTRFAFVAFEGMTLLDLVGAYDPVSRIASMGFDPTSTCEIICAHGSSAWSHAGVEIVAERVRPPLGEFDVLVVPGGHGTRVLEHDPSLVAWLASFPENRLVASVCTGALLLGAAGRLKGKRATTHHTAHHRLADYGATLAPGRVVDEGQLVTAGGVTSAIDLGLYLVRRLEGDAVADAIAAQMEWPPRT